MGIVALAVDKIVQGESYYSSNIVFSMFFFVLTLLKFNISISYTCVYLFLMLKSYELNLYFIFSVKSSPNSVRVRSLLVGYQWHVPIPAQLDHSQFHVPPECHIQFPHSAKLRFNEKSRRNKGRE